METADGKREFTDIICDQCESTQLYREFVEYSFPYAAGHSEDYKTIELTTKIPIYGCESCDYEHMRDDSHEAAHEAICKHLNILTPSKIRKFRDRLGMTREQFKDAYGIGTTTLGRWERGELIQNKANDNLLKCLHLAGTRRAIEKGLPIVYEEYEESVEQSELRPDKESWARVSPKEWGFTEDEAERVEAGARAFSRV